LIGSTIHHSGRVKLTAGEKAGAAGEWRSNWTLVAAATAGMMLSALATGSIGIFMAPLEQEFGWSRAQISSGPALVSFVAMMLATMVGFSADKLGPRRIGIAAAILMCGALAAMGTVSAALWHWWALWAVVGIAASAMPTVWLAPIMASFSDGRGLALAIVLSGTGVTNALVPIVANYFVVNHGWREGYIAIATLWALFTLPLVLLFFRGLRPAGRRDLQTSGTLPGLTARQGFRSRLFYMIALAAFLSTVAGVALILNLFPVLVSTGISRGDAAWIAGLMGVATITGRLFGGWLMDRLNAGFIAGFAALLGAALPASLLLWPGSVAAAVAGVAIYGLVGGAKIPAIAYLTGRHLGQRAFGTLYGTISASIALSVALGPLTANIIYDATKSYELVMWAVVPALAIAAVLYMTLGPYPDFGEQQEDE
jgi:MFS family permease